MGIFDLRLFGKKHRFEYHCEHLLLTERNFWYKSVRGRKVTLKRKIRPVFFQKKNSQKKCRFGFWPYLYYYLWLMVINVVRKKRKVYVTNTKNVPTLFNKDIP